MAKRIGRETVRYVSNIHAYDGACTPAYSEKRGGGARATPLDGRKPPSI